MQLFCFAMNWSEKQEKVSSFWFCGKAPLREKKKKRRSDLESCNVWSIKVLWNLVRNWYYMKESLSRDKKKQDDPMELYHSELYLFASTLSSQRVDPSWLLENLKHQLIYVILQKPQYAIGRDVKSIFDQTNIILSIYKSA